jgi:hypothetical protein
MATTTATLGARTSYGCATTTTRRAMRCGTRWTADDGATTRDDGEHQEHGEGEREGCVEARRIDGEATRDREDEARRRRGGGRDRFETTREWIGRIGDGAREVDGVVRADSGDGKGGRGVRVGR